MKLITKRKINKYELLIIKYHFLFILIAGDKMESNESINGEKILKDIFGDVSFELVKLMRNVNFKEFEEKVKKIK